MFIGIVVASMLKNTGSQATVSQGYGLMGKMNSTVSSGIVATESYVWNPANQAELLSKLTEHLQSKKTATLVQPYLIHDDTKKRKLADGQFFRSRLMDFNKDDTTATFKIESGKSAGGKSIKTAYVFYKMGNLAFSGERAWPGGNTVLMNMFVQYGTGNINVKGHTTFMDVFAMQADRYKFEPDPNTGEGSVFFYKQSTFSDIDFKVPAFFNDDVVTGTTTFDTIVGFNRNVSTKDAATLTVKYNMWVKEGFARRNFNDAYLTARDYENGNNVTGAQAITLTGVSGKTLYYTDNLPARYTNNAFDANGTSNDNCDTLVSINKGWGCYPRTDGSTTINTITPTKIATFTTSQLLSYLGMTKEKAAADTAVKYGKNPDSAAAQSRIKDEPTLNPTNITAAGKEFLNLTTLTGTTSGNGVSVSLDMINKWYVDYPNSGATAKYYSEGHLLINVDNNITFTGIDPANKFNNKIAFVVNDNHSIDSKYFDSGNDASTLIYVGEHGRLSNFGCDNSFRGLIYMDESNNQPYESQHTFEWGPNSTIDGAVLLKGKGRINWNTKDKAGFVTITKNDEILKGFTGFLPLPDPNDPSAGGTTVGLKAGADSVSLRPIGYYYNAR